MSSRIIIFIGAPGSGKSTQSSLLSKRLLIPHLSTGNILRNLVNRQIPNRDLVKKCLSKGELIPDNVMGEIIKSECKDQKCENGFILDGYPRNVEQFEYFLSIFAKDSIYMLFFEIDFLYLKERILKRYYCTGCNFIYNGSYNNPSVEGVCDYCGGKDFALREDDNESVLQKRFDNYISVTEKLKNFCKERVKCFVINAERKTDEISEEIYRLIS